jgi:hypothetical protein
MGFTRLREARFGGRRKVVRFRSIPMPSSRAGKPDHLRAFASPRESFLSPLGMGSIAQFPSGPASNLRWTWGPSLKFEPIRWMGGAEDRAGHLCVSVSLRLTCLRVPAGRGVHRSFSPSPRHALLLFCRPADFDEASYRSKSGRAPPDRVRGKLLAP